MHEALIKDYVEKNKLEEVVVHGKTYSISKDFFKIKFNFSQYNEPCTVCNLGVICQNKYKFFIKETAICLLKHVIKDFFSVFPDFTDFDQVFLW